MNTPDRIKTDNANDLNSISTNKSRLLELHKFETIDDIHNIFYTETHTKIEIGYMFRITRKVLGITMSDMAKDIKTIHKSNLSKFERGESSIESDYVQRNYETYLENYIISKRTSLNVNRLWKVFVRIINNHESRIANVLKEKELMVLELQMIGNKLDVDPWKESEFWDALHFLENQEKNLKILLNASRFLTRVLLIGITWKETGPIITKHSGSRST